MSNESYRQLPRRTVNDLFSGDRLQEILKVAFGEQVSETNERDEKIARVVWAYHSSFCHFDERLAHKSLSFLLFC